MEKILSWNCTIYREWDNFFIVNWNKLFTIELERMGDWYVNEEYNEFNEITSPDYKEKIMKRLNNV